MNPVISDFSRAKFPKQPYTVQFHNLLLGIHFLLRISVTMIVRLLIVITILSHSYGLNPFWPQGVFNTVQDEEKNVLSEDLEPERVMEEDEEAENDEEDDAKAVSEAVNSLPVADRVMEGE